MVSDVVLVAIIAAVPPTLVALGALIQSIRTHKLVNSRMTELLSVSKRDAAAAATLEEKSAQADRSAGLTRSDQRAAKVQRTRAEKPK